MILSAVGWFLLPHGAPHPRLHCDFEDMEFIESDGAFGRFSCVPLINAGDMSQLASVICAAFPPCCSGLAQTPSPSHAFPFRYVDRLREYSTNNVMMHALWVEVYPANRRHATVILVKPCRITKAKHPPQTAIRFLIFPTCVPVCLKTQA